MKRRNLIPITRIYDIYLKYTYSVDVKKFMDEIVDIDRANVYTKDEVIAMIEELKTEIEEMSGLCTEIHGDEWNEINTVHSQDVLSLIQQKIDKLKGEE